MQAAFVSVDSRWPLRHAARFFTCLNLFLSLIASASAETFPNIVLLYADDMGYGDLAIQNPESKIPTPHLDQLAKRGVRFTDAHSSSGVCTPSRYALLHGRYHWRKFHGIVNSFDQSVMDDERTTLPELLKSKGYRTACIGKWHLGWDWNAIKSPEARLQSIADGSTTVQAYDVDAFDWSKPIPGGPLAHGFDYYFGDDVPNFPPYAWFENDRLTQTPTVQRSTPSPTGEGNWETRPGPSVEGWDYWAVMPTLTDRAVQWIGQQSADTPFFLYVPFTSPHAPIVPDNEFAGKSRAGAYGDYVCQTDESVGRILHAIEAKGLRENTLVLFTSDNGPETYAYARIKNFEHRSMGPLRGLKRDLYEGGHRVPCIASWPAALPQGEVRDGLISQIDFYATIASIVEASIPSGSAEDSYDQFEFITGRSASKRLTLVHNTNKNGYALRHGDWVYLTTQSGAVSKVPDWFDRENGYAINPHPGELYNLRDDLAQRKNLYADHPEIVKDLATRLEQLQQHSQVR